MERYNNKTLYNARVLLVLLCIRFTRDRFGHGGGGGDGWKRHNAVCIENCVVSLLVYILLLYCILLVSTLTRDDRLKYDRKKKNSQRSYILPV